MTLVFMLLASFFLVGSPRAVASTPPTAAKDATAVSLSAQNSAGTGLVHAERLGPVDDAERTVTSAIAARDAHALVALFSGPMRDALPEAKAGAFIDGLLRAKGALLKVSRQPGSTGARVGEYRVEAERGAWRLKLTVDDSGLVTGLNFGEPPAAEPPVATSTVALNLPFRGRWLVFWGGDTLDKNQHVTHHSQRRAADLVVGMTPAAHTLATVNALRSIWRMGSRCLRWPMAWWSRSSTVCLTAFPA